MNDLICLNCPNGCRLLIERINTKEIRVQGNKCEKGVAFARRFLKENGQSYETINTSLHKPVYDGNVLTKICALWDISFKTTRPGLMPPGSPERTIFRLVIENTSKSLFVLEQIRPATFHAKLKIIHTLDYLHTRGLSMAVPYLKDSQGRAILEFQNGFWQIVPYIPGENLDRQVYMFDAWRADVLSRFLIDLNKCADEIPIYKNDEGFSLKKYIASLVGQINIKHPELKSPITRITSFLGSDFFTIYDALPLSFCNGDFHPMNVIWGKDHMKAMIDWEFAGIKPELYDLANMVGCLGIEHPSSLTRDLVVNLVRKLHGARIFKDISWSYFFELVVALRFAWLSEWLRKKDHDMIDMELEYMHLLIENKNDILHQWGFKKE